MTRKNIFLIISLMIFFGFSIFFGGCRNVSIYNKTDNFDLAYQQPNNFGLKGLRIGYDMDTSIDVDWVFDLNAAMSSTTPYFGRDFIVVSTKYGKLYAIERNTGKQWGVRSLDGAVDRAFFAEKEIVYFGTADKDIGVLSAVNIKSGNEYWTVETGPIESELLVNDNAVFAGTYSGQIYSVNKLTGAVNWKYSLPKTNRILSNILSLNNNIVTVDDKGVLYMIDVKTGALNGKMKVAGNFDGRIYCVDNKIFLADRDGNIFCVNVNDLTECWKISSPYGKISGGFTFEGDHFYAVTIKGTLVSVEIMTGKIAALAQLDEGSSVSPVVTPNQFICSLNNSKVVVLDRKSVTAVKTYSFDGRVKSPVFVLSPEEAFVYVEDKLFVRLKRPGAAK
jgi:outer membrane protein assembly factor BamB